jgi:hypothetical protein
MYEAAGEARNSITLAISSGSATRPVGDEALAERGDGGVVERRAAAAGAQHRRVDLAGADRVHADPGACDVDRHRPGQHRDRAHRRAVGGHVRARHEAVHRRDVDDRAAASREHRARGRAARVEEAVHVDGEHAAPIVVVRVERPAPQHDAGGVHEHVEAAVVGHDRRDGRVAGRRVGDVEPACLDALRQRALGGAVQVEHDDPVARCCEAGRRRGAHAGRAARHDDHAPPITLAHRPSPFRSHQSTRPSMPPATASTSPLVWPAAGDEIQTIARATSSGVATLRSA